VTTERCILSVKYVPAASAKGLGGFLRYVQFRDLHADLSRGSDLEGLTKYVAHRDRTAPGGRLFGPRGNAGDLDRRALLAHISRSLRQPGGRHPRAAYRMVLSPERAEGLDLKALTRAAMSQLGKEVGGEPPWIAAIHHNTKHPHVHIVMAARRELERGHFKTVVISRERLGRMKQAIGAELVHERGGRQRQVDLRDFAPAEAHSGQRQQGGGFGLILGVTGIVDRALKAFAVQQRREFQRWLAEEDERLRKRAAERQRQSDYRVER
jgi:hypothetical protein